MSTYDRFIKSRQLSRRRVIGGGTVALLAVSEEPKARANAAVQSKCAATDDHLAIADLMYRYGIAVDSLDRAALEDCFASGAIKPELFDWTIDYHKKYAHTMHSMGNHTYRVHGDTAKGVTYCIASMVKDVAGKLVKFDVYFMYRDEFLKQRDRWRICKRQLEIIFSTEEMPVQPGAPLLGFSVKPGSFRDRPALSTLEPT